MLKSLREFLCVIGGALCLAYATRKVPGFHSTEWLAMWVSLCLAGAYWHYVHEGKEHGK